MWPFTDLVTSIQSKFSAVSTDYNQVHELARQLEKKQLKLDQQSVLVTGFKNMLTNRYNGIMTIDTVMQKALQGGYWAWYFGASATLQRDVEASSKAWLRSKLSLPNLSVQSMLQVGATTFGTTSNDLQVIQYGGQKRAMKEAQFLAVSTSASIGISSVLKMVSARVQQQYTQQFLNVARRSWQMSGVLAFCYGMGRIADAIHETGPFAEHLVEKRDGFIRGQQQEIDRRFEKLARYVEEEGPWSWLD